MEKCENPPAVIRRPQPSPTNSDVVRLHIAVIQNRRRKVIKYVKRGTPINAFNYDGQPPLFCAALLGKRKVVKALLDLGANPNVRCYPEGSTPTHGACYVGCVRSLKLLLQAGGDLRLTDSKHKTPLDWAIQQSDEIKRRNIKDVLDGARMCAFKSSGKELLPDLESRIGTGLDDAYHYQPSRILQSFPCYAAMAKLFDFEKRLISQVKLNHSVLPFGYGKIYYGTDQVQEQRCGALIGLPFVNEISDLKLEEAETSSASWICGKFTTFVPMVWTERKTSVSVRELRKSTVEDAIPDILIAELDALVKLHHPSILMLLAVCHVDNYDSISLVFEKIPLGSLYFVLYNQFKRLSSRFVTEIIISVCEALDFIHASGYLHGFVNSHSIFLVDAGRAKLGCLEYITPSGASGECIQASAHPCLRSDSHLSIYRHWAAPEVITGSRAATKQSDIYSVCCVMWELIYGEVPWKDYMLESLRVTMIENPSAKLPLDKGIVPDLWYHVLNLGLEPELPLRDLDLTEVKDMMILSKSKIVDAGASGDSLQLRVSGSRTSLKSYDDPQVVASHDAVDAEKDKLYTLTMFGPHTAV